MKLAIFPIFLSNKNPITERKVWNEAYFVYIDFAQSHGNKSFNLTFEKSMLRNV